MKSLIIISITTILLITSAGAWDMEKYYSGDLPNCPHNSDQLLEVTKFLSFQSADYKSSKGTCFVKTNYYSWWDLINEQQRPHEVEIDAGKCNSKDFLKYDGKLFVKGTVLYQGEVSMCGSNPGCHYECKPKIELWSL